MCFSFSGYSSLEFCHPLSQSWFCCLWTTQENTFPVHLVRSTWCIGVHKSSHPFCLQFHQDIPARSSHVLPTCSQIYDCWMSLRSECLWSLPAVHLEALLKRALWNSTLSLFVAVVFYSCMGALLSAVPQFLHQKRELKQRAGTLSRALQDNDDFQFYGYMPHTL